MKFITMLLLISSAAVTLVTLSMAAEPVTKAVKQLSSAVVELSTAPGPVTQSVKRPGGALIVGHSQTDLNRIPVAYIDKARKEISIWYGHTSHGSQITSGMQAMNRPPFHFSEDGAGGGLKNATA